MNKEVNQEINEKLKKYMEVNENENTTMQKVWDATKAVIRGKYIAIQAFLKKEEKSQIHNLTYTQKDLEKEQQLKHKTTRRQEIIKIRAEINAIKNNNNNKKQNNRTDQ